ncbi:electron transport complex, RnfABCDGE type, C subunit, partial [Vibrio cholerae O1 str. 116059]
SSANSSYAKQ